MVSENNNIRRNFSPLDNVTEYTLWIQNFCTICSISDMLRIKQ